MIKLYGMGRSNYFSIAKVCLVVKGMTFEEVATAPSQENDYLAKSPMGKIPCIETERGFLSEAYANADYLVSIQPEPRLLPLVGQHPSVQRVEAEKAGWATASVVEGPAL